MQWFATFLKNIHYYDDILPIETDQKVKIKVPGEKEDNEARRGGEEYTEEETALEKMIIEQYQ